MSYKKFGIGIGFLSILGTGIFLSDFSDDKMKNTSQKEESKTMVNNTNSLEIKDTVKNLQQSHTTSTQEVKVSEAKKQQSVYNYKPNSYEAKKQEEYKQRYENFVKAKIAQAKREQKYIDYYKKQSEQAKKMAYISANKDKMNPQSYMSSEQRKLIAFRNWQEQQRMKQAMMNKNIQVNN
jgi:hypothetical protein